MSEMTKGHAQIQNISAIYLMKIVCFIQFWVYYEKCLANKKRIIFFVL